MTAGDNRRRERYVHNKSIDRRRFRRGAPGAVCRAGRRSVHRGNRSGFRSGVRHGKDARAVAGCDRAGRGNAAHGRHHFPEEDHGRAPDSGGDLLHVDRQGGGNHPAGAGGGCVQHHHQAQAGVEAVPGGFVRRPGQRNQGGGTCQCAQAGAAACGFAAGSVAQAVCRCDSVCRHARHGRDHRARGGDRHFHRRDAGTGDGAYGVAAGMPRHRHRAAYAGKNSLAHLRRGSTSCAASRCARRGAATAYCRGGR